MENKDGFVRKLKKVRNSNRRVTPHRQRREEAKGKELAEANQKIRQLTRQVAHLRKELLKRKSYEPDIEDVVSDGEPKVTQHRCPTCNSKDIKVVALPTGLMSSCSQCGARQKITGIAK